MTVVGSLRSGSLTPRSHSINDLSMKVKHASVVVVVVVAVVAGVALTIDRENRAAAYESTASFFPKPRIGLKGQPERASELDEIRSSDFLEEVAERIGPDEVLGTAPSAGSKALAGEMIGSNLTGRWMAEW